MLSPLVGGLNELQAKACQKVLYGILLLAWCEKRKDTEIYPTYEGRFGAFYKYESRWLLQIIPFSAFWLRSSVVSVLISLISDTWPIRPHDINLIFFMGAAPVWGSLLSLGAACVASVLHCHWGHTGAPPPLSNPKTNLSYGEERRNWNPQNSLLGGYSPRKSILWQWRACCFYKSTYHSSKRLLKFNIYGQT